MNNRKLQVEDYHSISLFLDKKFKIVKNLVSSTTPFSSNGSERHAAFVCGLGTFGSIITTLKLELTQGTYIDDYGYCNMCGVCTKKCQVGISCESKIPKPFSKG